MMQLDIVHLDKSETETKEKVSTKDLLYRHLYQPGEQHGD